MTTQINLRLSNDFLKNLKDYAKNNGYLNIQELIRDIVREKIYSHYELREDYIKKLNSNEANTFLSDVEADDFDKELEKRLKLK